MKIAIFGGAFNPVHREHVNIVKAAVAQAGFDKVFIVPTGISPHKSGRLAASAEQRTEMCRIAFAEIPQAEISSFETEREGVSYSYITCEHFRALYPNDRLFLLVGADMLAYFPKWKYPERILNCASLAACAREDEKQFDRISQDFETLFDRPLIKIGYVGDNVSSTRIRTLAALGEDVSAYTDKKVAEYIATNRVFLQEKLAEAKNFLTPSRWQHTLRVACLAARYAQRAGVDEAAAVTAAALHDVAKYLPPDSPFLEGFQPPAGVPEPVMHQYTGAYVAHRFFGVDDEDILNAVKYHTSGRENMSPLEKLIYLADMLEEGRNFRGVDGLRALFERDMDECLLAALGEQVDYLNETGKPVYPLTQRAYEYLKDKKDGKH